MLCSVPGSRTRPETQLMIGSGGAACGGQVGVAEAGGGGGQVEVEKRW